MRVTFIDQKSKIEKLQQVIYNYKHLRSNLEIRLTFIDQKSNLS